MKPGRLLIWAFLLAVPFWMSSCKKENGGDVLTPNSVEGSWQVSGIKLKQGNQTEDYLELIKQYLGADAVACLTESKMTFNGNGKVTGVASPKCQAAGGDDLNPVADNSSWSVNGNKLTITSSDGPQVYDLTVSGNSMTWSINEQDDLDGDGTIDNYTTIIEFKRA